MRSALRRARRCVHPFVLLSRRLLPSATVSTLSCHLAAKLELMRTWEQVTLMDWGNAIVRQKTIGADGKVTALLMDLYLEGDFKLTKKKITWLAQPVEGGPLPLSLFSSRLY